MRFHAVIALIFSVLSAWGTDSGIGPAPATGGGGGVTTVNTRAGAVTLVASDIPTMVASGVGHAGGITPDTPAGAGSTKFLREDGTWGVPSGSGPSTPTGTGFIHVTSGSQDGAAALVTQSDMAYGRTAVSNTTHTVAASEGYIAQTGTMSAARAWTLPAASAVSAGWTTILYDESGTVSWWYPINVTPDGSDTINGLASSSPHKINIPYSGMRLVSDGTSAWVAYPLPSARPDMWILDSDAYATTSTPAGIFQAVASSGVIDVTTTGLIDTTHPGYIRMRGNGGTTDRIAAVHAAATQIRLGGGLWRQEWLVNVPTLSTAAQEYQLWIGFGDAFSTANDETDGVYFFYDRLNVGTTWQCKTSSNTSRTIVDSGSTVTAATFVKLAIEINAAATSVSFFVDGVLVPTAGMPISTNIPTGAGRELGIAARFAKTAGSTATAGIEIDRYRELFMSTTPR